LNLFKQKEGMLKELEWIDYRITHFDALQESEILSVINPNIFNE